MTTKDVPMVPDTAQRIQTFSADDVPPADAPWGRFRKRVETRAVRIEGPFMVETSEGPLTCQDGWLAMDARGYPYPIAADEFALIYEPVPEVDQGYGGETKTGWKRTPGRCVACGSTQMVSDEALICSMCEQMGVDGVEIMQIKMGTAPGYITSIHGLTVADLPFDGTFYTIPDGTRVRADDAEQALQNWRESAVGQVEGGTIL